MISIAGRSPSEPAGHEAPRAPGWLSCATLLRRVFAIEVLVCPCCAGRAGFWAR
jgi:hypothetical protein